MALQAEIWLIVIELNQSLTLDRYLEFDATALLRRMLATSKYCSLASSQLIQLPRRGNHQGGMGL